MNLKEEKEGKPITILKVISQTKESVKVLLPSLEVPVEMTNKYFNYLQSTGAYMVIYCIASNVV